MTTRPPACADCKHCQVTPTKRKKTYACALNGADCYTERAEGDCGRGGKNWEGR